MIRDLPVSGRGVTLVWIRRRFVCSNCDVGHLEDHVVFEGALTRRLARQLVADAKVMSIRAVVRGHGLNWHLIQDLGDVVVGAGGRAAPQLSLSGVVGR